MTYDLYLLRHSDTIEPTVDSVVNYLESQEESEYQIYKPTPKQLEDVERLLESIDALSQEQIGFEAGWYGPDDFSLGISYWGEHGVYESDFVRILNEFASKQEGNWFWFDPQIEEVMDNLVFEGEKGGETNVVNEEYFEPERSPLFAGLMALGIIACAAIVAFVLSSPIGSSGPCYTFEEYDLETDTCAVLCYEDETQDECDRRAIEITHQYEREAGLPLSQFDNFDLIDRATE